jgi:hypothetical protein
VRKMAGRCEGNTKKEGVMDPSKQQMSKILDKLEEKHHSILFIYKSIRQKYGKLLEHMENELLLRKDPFPKTVADVCRILTGWKNK